MTATDEGPSHAAFLLRAQDQLGFPDEVTAWLKSVASGKVVCVPATPVAWKWRMFADHGRWNYGPHLPLSKNIAESQPLLAAAVPAHNEEKP